MKPVFKIVLQCVAPLVPNADGTDCVRPAAKQLTCDRPNVVRDGRCVSPRDLPKNCVAYDVNGKPYRVVCRD